MKFSQPSFQWLFISALFMLPRPQNLAAVVDRCTDGELCAFLRAGVRCSETPSRPADGNYVAISSPEGCGSQEDGASGSRHARSRRAVAGFMDFKKAQFPFLQSGTRKRDRSYST